MAHVHLQPYLKFFIPWLTSSSFFHFHLPWWAGSGFFSYMHRSTSLYSSSSTRKTSPNGGPNLRTSPTQKSSGGGLRLWNFHQKFRDKWGPCGWFLSCKSCDDHETSGMVGRELSPYLVEHSREFPAKTLNLASIHICHSNIYKYVCVYIYIG